MRWQFGFSKSILSKGKAYFNQNRVKDLTNTQPGKYEAKVRGTRTYTVTLTFKNDTLSAAGCSCPYAREGYACKHMSAVCYAIEDMITSGNYDENGNAQKNASKEKILNVAKDTDLLSGLEDKFYYYDLEEIFSEVYIKESIFKQAEKIARSGNLTMSQAVMRETYNYRNGKYMPVLQVSGFMIRDGNRAQVVDLMVSRSHIETLNCNMRSCHHTFSYNNSFFYTSEIRIKPCAHEMALLILLTDYILKNNPGDLTDESAKAFMSLFHKTKNRQSLSDKDNLKNSIIMTPRLELNEKGLFLGFRIGINKMYVLKDISKMTQLKQSGGTLHLGKGNEINFLLSDFNEESRPLYEMAQKVVDQEKRRNEFFAQSYRYEDMDALKISGNMPLTGEQLDEFYSLMEGKKTELKDKLNIGGYYDRTILISEKNPQITMELEDSCNTKNQFEGLNCLIRYPVIFKGIEHSYFLDKEGLHKIPEKYLSILNSIKDQRIGGIYNYVDEKSMKIGHEHLAEFYQRILPELSEYMTVVESEDTRVEEFLPEIADYHFYLDYQNKNILGQAFAQYADQKCDIADYIKVNPKDIPVGSDVYALIKAQQSFRDTYTEKTMLDKMIDVFESYDPETKEFVIEEEDHVFSFMSEGFEELLSLGEVHVTDRFKNINVRKQANLSVGVSIESDLLNLKISSGELSSEELMEILESYRLKKKYHRMRNGDFLEINESSMEELSMLMDSMHISTKEFVQGKMHLPLYRAFYMDKMLEANEEIYSNRDKTFRTLVKNFKTVNDSDYEIPQSLNAVMRNYQIYGFKWLKVLSENGFGGILADDMGLGKTLQIIAYLLSEKEEREAGSKEDHCALIVSPASLIYNWLEEFHKFAPTMKVGVLAGTPSERKELLEKKEDYDALITSYHLLSRDIGNYEDKSFKYHVIDEAQFIKNKNTGISKAVRLIKSSHRFALTGTPIENRLSELWTIFDFLMPGFLYNYDTFRRELENPIVKDKEEDAMKRLKRMISSFILRRLKQDVLKDLPDKLEEVRYARMEKKQQQLYDAQVSHMLSMLENQSDDEFKKNKVQILAEITKIRQICCDPNLLMANYKGDSAKKDALMDLIDQSIDGGHRMLIFSQFTSMLSIIEEELKDKKIPYYVITGSTPKKTRLELVKAFNNDETPVFLISLKAGGTGLNLIGADCVVHYDPWWNVAVQNQATDRAHRIGQTKIVNVYKLIIKNTIEEKIIALQEAKKNLAEEILSGDMGSMGSLTREELLELFS